jgi:hypothetical protein
MTRLSGHALFVSILTLGAPCHAEPRDLSEKQPAVFYVSHGGVAASAIAGSALLYGYAPAHTPRTGSWFSFEDSVERNFSPTAISLSDGLLVASVLVPVAAQAGSSGTQFGNTMLVYGESLSLSLWLNSAVKYAVLRARPYTHNPNPVVKKLMERHRRDENLSFYSGHASTAFTALVSGGLVFSATHEADGGERRAFWAVQAALAGATSHLRVRAGKHYYSDVLVGAVVGSGLGVLVPYAAGVRYELDGGDWAALGGGLVVGTGLALFVPSDELNLVPRNQAARWLPHIDAVGVTPSRDGAGWLVSLGGQL